MSKNIMHHKSWHPQTGRFLEKIWRAEQKNVQEKKAQAQLLEEQRKERERNELRALAIVCTVPLLTPLHPLGAGQAVAAERLDWMYENPLDQIGGGDEQQQGASEGLSFVTGPSGLQVGDPSAAPVAGDMVSAGATGGMPPDFGSATALLLKDKKK
eukprot:gene10968-1991_t